jgi:hypothetical protein
MKKQIAFVLFSVLISLTSQAQVIQQQKSLTLPPFDIVQADGSHYRATEIPMGEPVLILYFDPDCEHCELFINELRRDLDAFEGIHIVMVTYVPLRTLKNFIEKTGMNNYPQVKVGTEGESFIVRYHYDVIQFPFVALHDKSGKLFSKFENDVPPPAELSKMFTKK